MTAQYDPAHPASHERCEPDCPCTCGDRSPYEANAGTMCRNCCGMIERKRISRLEPIAEAGGITIYATRWELVASAVSAAS